jgi:hypothetical protein
MAAAPFDASQSFDLVVENETGISRRLVEQPNEEPTRGPASQCSLTAEAVSMSTFCDGVWTRRQRYVGGSSPCSSKRPATPPAIHDDV